jgi:hypothetical protein
MIGGARGPDYAAALLGFVAALSAGCSNTPSNPIMGSSVSASTLAPSIAVSSTIVARTTQVASTAARARLCDIAFDPATLKARYLSFEAKQGLAGAQLSQVEKDYDSTYNAITQGQGSVASTGCKQGEWTVDRTFVFSSKYKDEVAVELRHYLAGSFALKRPDRSPSDEVFEHKKFWKEQDDN